MSGEFWIRSTGLHDNGSVIYCRRFEHATWSAFIQSLYLDHDKRIELEIKNWEQAYSQIWHTERRNRIIASNFGRVCKMRPTTLCRSTVYDMFVVVGVVDKILFSIIFEQASSSRCCAALCIAQFIIDNTKYKYNL